MRCYSPDARRLCGCGRLTCYTPRLLGKEEEEDAEGEEGVPVEDGHVENGVPNGHNHGEVAEEIEDETASEDEDEDED